MIQGSIQVDMAGEIRSIDSGSERSGSTATRSESSSRENPKPHNSHEGKKSKRKTEKVLVDVDDVEAAVSQAKATISATTTYEYDGKAATSQADAITVTDLNVYDGETLAEQVESFIKKHPVAMFNRSWCLFSVDAIDFMVNHLQISVYSLDVDTHPQGKEILKHICTKTGHKTTPAIFIQGEFLGGFEEVNSLYASGVLQRDYLAGFSQAEKCEEFIHKANLTKKPLFWFPETMNAYAIRIGGIVTCFSSVAAAIMVYWVAWGAYLAYALACDFLLRILGGSCLSPIGRLSCLLAKCFGNKMRVGRPKQFALLCGFMFAFMGSIFFAIPLYGFNLAGSITLGMLAMATGMEGFLDYCLGCTIFKYGVKLGIISK